MQYFIKIFILSNSGAEGKIFFNLFLKNKIKGLEGACSPDLHPYMFPKFLKNQISMYIYFLNVIFFSD